MLIKRIRVLMLLTLLVVVMATVVGVQVEANVALVDIPCATTTNAWTVESNSVVTLKQCNDKSMWQQDLVITCNATTGGGGSSVLQNVSIVVSDSIMAFHFDMATCILDNVTLTMVNSSSTWRGPSNGILLWSPSIVTVQRLNRSHIHFRESLMVQPPCLVLVMDIAITDSVVELRGVTIVNGSDSIFQCPRMPLFSSLQSLYLHNLSISIHDSNVSTVVSRIGQMTGLISFDELNVSAYDGIAMDMYRATISCRQSISDPAGSLIDDHPRFSCIGMVNIFPTIASNVSLVVSESELVVIGNRATSLSSFQEAIFFRALGVGVGSQHYVFPEDYASFNNGSVVVFNTFLSTQCSGMTALVHLDNLNVVATRMDINNVTLHQRSEYDTGPYTVMRLASVFFTTPITILDQCSIRIASVSMISHLLSGTTAAVNSPDIRALSSVRSAVILVHYTRDTNISISNTTLVAVIAGGSFSTRGRNRNTVSLMDELPLGIITAGIVYFQSEFNVYSRNTAVVVVDSSITVFTNFSISSFVTSQNALLYSIGFALYSVAAALLFLTSNATNNTAIVCRCSMQHSSASSMWLALQNSFPMAMFVNISAAVICQASEGSLFALQASSASSNQWVFSQLTPLYASFGSSMSNCSVDVRDCNFSTDVSSSQAPLSTSQVSLAAIFIPSDFSVGSTFCGYGLSTWPLVDGVVSLSSSAMNASLVVLSNVTLGSAVYLPPFGMLQVAQNTSLVFHRVDFVSTAATRRIQDRFLVGNGFTVRQPITTPVTYTNRLEFDDDSFAGFDQVFENSSAFFMSARLTPELVWGCNAWDGSVLNNAFFESLNPSSALYPQSILNVPNISHHLPSRFRFRIASSGAAGYVTCNELVYPTHSNFTTVPMPSTHELFLRVSIPPQGASAVVSCVAVALCAVGGIAGSLHPIFLQVGLLSLKLARGGVDDECAFSIGLLDSPMMLSIGDFGDEVGSAAFGAIVGDFLICLSAGACAWLGGVGILFLRYRRHLSSINVLNILSESYRTGCLPGALMAPLCVFLQPIVSSSVFLIFIIGSTSAVVAGVASLLLAVGCLIRSITFACWERPCQSIPYPASYIERHVRSSHEKNSAIDGPEKNTRWADGIPSNDAIESEKIRVDYEGVEETTVWGFIVLWFKRWTIHRWHWISTGKRTSKHETTTTAAVAAQGEALHLSAHQLEQFLRCYGPFFEAYRARFQWFLCVELMIPFCCGVIAGVAQRVGCITSMWLLFTVSLIGLLLGMSLPFVSHLLNSNFIVNAVLTIVCSILSILGLDDAVNTVVMIQFGIVILQVGCDWCGGFVHGTSRLFVVIQQILALVRSSGLDKVAHYLWTESTTETEQGRRRRFHGRQRAPMRSLLSLLTARRRDGNESIADADHHCLISPPLSEKDIADRLDELITYLCRYRTRKSQRKNPDD